MKLPAQLGSPFPQVINLAAMKKFQKESKGMLPDSPEWNAVRNQIYDELRRYKFDAQKKTLERG